MYPVGIKDFPIRRDNKNVSRNGNYYPPSPFLPLPEHTERGYSPMIQASTRDNAFLSFSPAAFSTSVSCGEWVQSFPSTKEIEPA